MNGHDLIELGRGVLIDGHRRLGRDAVGAAAHVGDDDLVAEPVHLEEWRGAHEGLRRRFGPYMADMAPDCQ
jgi:hypothetical protein